MKCCTGKLKYSSKLKFIRYMLYMRELLQFCLLWTIDWGGHRVLDGIHDRSRQQLYTMKSTSHHHQKPALEFFWSICSSFFVRGKTFFSFFMRTPWIVLQISFLGGIVSWKNGWLCAVLGHKSQHSIKCEIFMRFPCYIFCINAKIHGRIWLAYFLKWVWQLKWRLHCFNSVLLAVHWRLHLLIQMPVKWTLSGCSAMIFHYNVINSVNKK